MYDVIAPNVVNSVLVQPKAKLLIWAVDKVLDIFAHVVGQFFEEHLHLVICERSH